MTQIALSRREFHSLDFGLLGGSAAVIRVHENGGTVRVDDVVAADVRDMIEFLVHERGGLLHEEEEGPQTLDQQSDGLNGVDIAFDPELVEAPEEERGRADAEAN